MSILEAARAGMDTDIRPQDDRGAGARDHRRPRGHRQEKAGRALIDMDERRTLGKSVVKIAR